MQPAVQEVAQQTPSTQNWLLHSVAEPHAMPASFPAQVPFAIVIAQTSEQAPLAASHVNGAQTVRSPVAVQTPFLQTLPSTTAPVSQRPGAHTLPSA
jgi:hypothetical protein